MSGTTEQIKILYDNGHTPEQIQSLIGGELTDILIILNSIGCLTKKKVKNNRELNAIITKSSPTIIDVAGGPAGNVESVGVSVSSSQDESAEQIYKRYQARIAHRICETAMAEIDPTVMPASVVLKAAIYVNEESTGRNEARAKKSDKSGLLELGEMLNHMRLANARVNAALGIPQGSIEVLTEKVGA